MKIRTAYALQHANTLAVPSTAAFYCEAGSVEDLRAALRWADRQGQAVLILGGGSNVLLAETLSGLVLKPNLLGRQVVAEQGGTVEVAFGAGENWHQAVAWALDQGLYGLENLGLIPGSVGAAPVQNIGAYGVELKDRFVKLEALNRSTGMLEVFDAERCQFEYRESAFKKSLCDQFIITSVVLRLSTQPELRLDYPALADALKDCPQPTPEQVFEAVCRIRRSKLPDPATTPNCGSFFKNPVVSEQQCEALSAQHPGLVAFDVPGSSQKKIAAGWLIDRAGWKGREIAGARVHADQALVLTNPGRKGASAVLELADAIREDIRLRYGIALEMEPQLLGWPGELAATCLPAVADGATKQSI